MRFNLFILLSLLIISCQSEPSDSGYTVISGNVVNSNVDTLFLFKSTQDTRQSPIVIPVVNSNFDYSFRPDATEAYELIFPDQLKRGSWLPQRFFSDRDSIILTLYEDQLPVIRSGTYSMEFSDFQNRTGKTVQTKIDSIYEIIEQLIAEGKDDSSPEMITQNEQIESFADDYYTSVWKYVTDNTSPVSYYQLYYIAESIESYPVKFEDIEKEFDRYALAFPDHPYTEILQKKISAVRTIKKGGELIDFTLPDLDGKDHNISTFTHGKITLLNLWASWCGPCIKKSREMVEIYDQYNGDDFTILGIAREFENTSRLKSAIERESFPWKNLIELDDEHEVWRSYNIPFSGGGMFLIDRNGIIVAVDPSADEVKEFLAKNL